MTLWTLLREVSSRVLGEHAACRGRLLFFPPAHKANDGIVPREGHERFLKIIFQVLTASLNERQKKKITTVRTG